ncbi:MAG TPA: transcription-repair coupling factor, partial [Glycomyces sp.]|nr:transcription-repair coupling factor [Glycomyces sp.]
MSEGRTVPNLARLLEAAAKSPKLARLAELASSSDRPVDVVAVPGARPLALAQAAKHAAGPVLAITATSREAEELAESLASFIAEEDIALYPAWETLPHERLSPRSDTVGARLELLHRLHAGDVPRVIVTPVRGALQPQLKGLGVLEPVELRRGDETDLTDLAVHLVDLAYERVDLVEKRGEFAVRGGILDVFPPTAQHPLRLEFFGDEVDSIREFSVADQRSLDEVDALRAVACRELLLTDDVRERAAELGETFPGLADMCAKLAQGIPVEGMESLLPALAGTDQLQLFQEILPRDALIVAIEPERIRSRALDLVATSNEFLEASWAAAAAGAEAPVDLGAGTFHDLAEARTAALAKGQRWWTISPFAAAPEEDAVAAELAAITGEPLTSGGVDDDAITVDLAFAETPRYHGNTAQLVADMQTWTREGRAVAVVYPALGGAER